MTEYLTEDSLGKKLEQIFGVQFVHDKTFIGKFRPDYRNDDLKLIVEFDGWQHYTSAINILRDYKKDKLEQDAGYKVIRWPYFVQMSSKSIKNLLGIDINVEQTYPHGFIDLKCILPADFCELGVEKFKKDLALLDAAIRQDIINSLKTKVNCAQFGELTVVPPSLKDLINT